MSLVPTGAFTIGYDAISLVDTGLSTDLSKRLLQFGITGGVYQGATGSTAQYIGAGGATGLLYIRDFNGGIPDVIIETDLFGNSTQPFSVTKGVSYSLSLLYTQDPADFYVPNTGGDYTDPVPIVMPTFPILPDGYFSADGQVITTTGITGANVRLTKAFYEGYAGSTSNYISIYRSPTVVGSSGIGMISEVSGTKVGTLKYVDEFGNASGTITYSDNFDVPPQLHYAVFNLNDTDRSANYVALGGINLPLTVNRLIYQTRTPFGVPSTLLHMYGISYGYTGLTAGDQVQITDFQDGGDFIETVQLDLKGIPYASHSFGGTGGTAQVVPGSSVRYYNGGQFSYSSVPIPAHRVGPEGITGSLNSCNIQPTNLLKTLSLRDFDYFDQDGNSIFSNYGLHEASTGIINLVSSYGTTGVLYTGPTGNSAGSGVTFTDIGSYNISFADPVPVESTALEKYDLSFYDTTPGGYSFNQTKGSTASLYYTWPGMAVYPEQIIVNDLTTSIGQSVSLSFSSFDYLDNHGFSIFDQGHTGTIQVYGPPFTQNSSVLVGTIPYGSGPYTIQTTASIEYNVPTSFLIAFNDFSLGRRTAIKVFQVTWQKETLQLVVYELPSESGVFNFEIGSLDYFSGDGTSLMYPPSGPTGYIQLMGPTGMLAEYPVSDRDTRYIFTY